MTNFFYYFFFLSEERRAVEGGGEERGEKEEGRKGQEGWKRGGNLRPMGQGVEGCEGNDDQSNTLTFRVTRGRGKRGRAEKYLFSKLSMLGCRLNLKQRTFVQITNHSTNIARKTDVLKWYKNCVFRRAVCH